MSDKNPSRNPQTVCKEKSLAVQSAKDEVDVNLIMRRFEKTGVLPVNMQQLVFTDVSEFGDYRTIRSHVAEVEQGFMLLPPGVRAEFQNDASAFLDFCANPENRPRLEELGLVEKTATPAVVETPAKPAIVETPAKPKEGAPGGA